jgi:23S rRNA pseudouridine1911/1915/1917 synthase
MKAIKELSIIHEDNHIIAVIKPQNVPCCPDESGDPDLLSQIKQYLKESGGKPGDAYCGLVHRLDRVTGGVMVYAKTSKAASRISDQLKDGRFQKTYLAVVVGEPGAREGELVDYLLKNPKTNVVEVVPFATTGAKRAELTYKTLQISKPKKVSLVKINLITGRSHQARVQMARIGCPIFGDAKYGGDRLAKGWNLALWAHELSFIHPTTGDTLRFVVNPPESTPWTEFDFSRGRRTN